MVVSVSVVSVILSLSCLDPTTTLAGPAENSGKLLPLLQGMPEATRNSFTWRHSNGSYRFGIRDKNFWRFEKRDDAGTVTGRYVFRTPEEKVFSSSYTQPAINNGEPGNNSSNCCMSEANNIEEIDSSYGQSGIIDELEPVVGSEYGNKEEVQPSHYQPGVLSAINYQPGETVSTTYNQLGNFVRTFFKKPKEIIGTIFNQQKIMPDDNHKTISTIYDQPGEVFSTSTFLKTSYREPLELKATINN